MQRFLQAITGITIATVFVSGAEASETKTIWDAKVTGNVGTSFPGDRSDDNASSGLAVGARLTVIAPFDLRVGTDYIRQIEENNVSGNVTTNIVSFVIEKEFDRPGKMIQPYLSISPIGYGKFSGAGVHGPDDGKTYYLAAGFEFEASRDSLWAIGMEYRYSGSYDVNVRRGGGHADNWDSHAVTFRLARQFY